MSPALPVLIDSDVLIWLTRGHVGAAQRLGQISTWRISVVTYMELAQGCRNRAAVARLKERLAARNTGVLRVRPAISAGWTSRPMGGVCRPLVSGSWKAMALMLAASWAMPAGAKRWKKDST
mgnify:CR=1 FL=1